MECGRCEYYKAHNCKRQCMELPDGKTCNDCIHVERCVTMFGAKKDNTSCGFEPIRFKLNKGLAEKDRKMNKNELKPCPFCGSKDIRTGSTGCSFGVDIYVKCCTCGAKMQICKEYGENELIKRWNSRA